MTLKEIDHHSRYRALLCGRPGTTARASLAIGGVPKGEGTPSHRRGFRTVSP